MSSDGTSGVQDASDIQAALDAWRARRGDAKDSVRLYFIEALAARAASQTGAARALLDQRLAELLQHDETLPAGPLQQISTTVPPAHRPLAELLAYLGSQPSGDSADPAPQDLARLRATYPELSVIDYFRDIWSRLNTTRQLKQSQEKVPHNAGPLNSSSLVHRSLALMGELSPGYLQHFLSHLDALSWMEQMKDSGAETGKEGQRMTTARKSGRR
ncbi:DUF2894 domain-containing protein [Allopusillimonas ginsengisoli]|uniref:DUF2894 domain-containing protein n=1 Tax=Allopusillimonas ginsengisoli TaxID=453575 RepID=UPI001021B0BA|nr:DUF2894 domain-containing protein [Allopusillimonas ginsengisoli]TEA80169.1 DUF2894 domain-containing protein [Allopusillimonas ginsengisoli]